MNSLEPVLKNDIETGMMPMNVNWDLHNPVDGVHP
jgi:hypothetical protein